MLTTTRCLQYFIGILFVVSSLLKINDPLGLTYKIDEYFDALNWLNLKSFSFSLAILMNVLEIGLGVALLFNIYMKLLRWVLLILMVFFTLLTAYAYFSSALKECGCLGNCFPIPAVVSFWKDIVLLVAVVMIVPKYELYYTPVKSVRSKQFIWWGSVIFAYLTQAYIYIKLPYADCLPFKEEVHIPTGMQTYFLANKDSVVMRFFYEKDGKELSFTVDEFPTDFDSTYQYLRREDEVIATQKANTGIADFVLTSLITGENIAAHILNLESAGIIIVLNKLGEERLEDLLKANHTLFRQKKGALYIVSADPEWIKRVLSRQNLSLGLGLVMDNVAIKTMGRSPLTYYRLVRGTIVSKQGITFANKLD